MAQPAVFESGHGKTDLGPETVQGRKTVYMSEETTNGEFVKCDGNHSVENPQEESAVPVIVSGGMLREPLAFKYCPFCIAVDRHYGFEVEIQ